MASKNVGLIVVILALLVSLGMSDSLDQDRAECTDKLVGLAMCLPYVSGQTKTPNLDCCTGLKQVVDDSKKCVCVLLKDRNNPNLGVKINSTIALNLPNACHVPANMSKCVELLHLDPNSSDAKLFQGLENKNGNSTTNIPATANGDSSSNGSTSASVDGKSDGGRGKKYHGIKMAFGALIIAFLAPQLLLYV